MNTEFLELTQAVGAVLEVFVYSTFCAFGGRADNYIGIKNRVWGRLIAPLFFISFIVTLNHRFSWWIVGYGLCFQLSHFVGYGGDTTLQKVFRRALHSTLRTASLIPLCLITGRWEVYIAQVICGLTVAVIFGVRNPVRAPQEELIINFSNSFLTPFVVL